MHGVNFVLIGNMEEIYLSLKRYIKPFQFEFIETLNLRWKYYIVLDSLDSTIFFTKENFLNLKIQKCVSTTVDANSQLVSG